MSASTSMALLSIDPDAFATLVQELPNVLTGPFDTGIREAEWQERALCAQTDPEAFFPEKGGSTREAKRICSDCDVRAECLDYALAHDERFGIWGGLSERERRRLRRGEIAVVDGQVVTQPPKSGPDRRFVDPEDLVCGDGACLEPVRLAPPAYWIVADGLPVPQLSHQDGTALCADPIEVSP